MKIESRPSPNFDDRGGCEVNLLVLHADGDASVDDCLAFCCRADAERRVSYHTVVGRTGRIFALVPAEKNAWHAGVSRFPGATRHSPRLGTDCVNKHSVGLCLSNRQDGTEPFPDAQLTAAALYTVSLMKAYPAITLERITTHGLCAVPGPNIRKVDPCPAGPFDLADFLERVRSVR